MRRLALALLVAAGCATAPPTKPDCQSYPLHPVSLTVRDGEHNAVWLFAARAKVERIRGNMERFGYDILDTTGGRHHVEWIGPTALPGVELGREYTWRAEFLGGWPTATGAVISDDAGLLFAAVADTGWGEHVLRDGIPGFRIRVLPATCPARPAGPCFTGIANVPIEFARGDEVAVAYHGQTVQVGGYDVHVVAAQTRGTGTGQCVDAGRNHVSFTIHRSGAPAYAPPR